MVIYCEMKMKTVILAVAAVLSIFCSFAQSELAEAKIKTPWTDTVQPQSILP